MTSVSATSMLAVGMGLGPQKEDSISMLWGEAALRWPSHTPQLQCSEDQDIKQLKFTILAWIYRSVQPCTAQIDVAVARSNVNNLHPNSS